MQNHHDGLDGKCAAARKLSPDRQSPVRRLRQHGDSPGTGRGRRRIASMEWHAGRSAGRRGGPHAARPLPSHAGCWPGPSPTARSCALATGSLVGSAWRCVPLSISSCRWPRPRAIFYVTQISLSSGSAKVLRVFSTSTTSARTRLAAGAVRACAAIGRRSPRTIGAPTPTGVRVEGTEGA